MTTVDIGRLRRSWAEPKGLVAWLATVDHKRIGLRYGVTAAVFFLAGGLEAAVMRAQLAQPERAPAHPRGIRPAVLDARPDDDLPLRDADALRLRQLPGAADDRSARHGVPAPERVRLLGLPRRRADHVWRFAARAQRPTTVGSTTRRCRLPSYSPGTNIDFYAVGLAFLGLSTTAGAINFIVTIFKLRAPGMSLDRLPLFCWAILATSFSIVVAIPSLTAACLLLFLQRNFGFHFFDTPSGGDPLLWQHLFWIFGHPDVYIIFLPAVGIVSSIVPTFSRRPMVGYTLMAFATMATAALGFGVWVHHMFATGLPVLSLTFFAAASLVIAIPSGIQVFGWLATMISGRPIISTPLLYVIGFLVTFVIGGLTGVMFAAIPFDQQVTDSYFVVAHFHYVLFGGAVFPILAAHPLLAAEDDRPDARRAPRAGLVLARLHRLQRRVLPDAHRGAARDATARLHLPGGHGLGHAQPDRDDRRLRARGRARARRCERDPLPVRRRAGRRRPVGRRDARVVDDLAATPYNFERIPIVASASPMWEPAADRERSRPPRGTPDGCDLAARRRYAGRARDARRIADPAPRRARARDRRGAADRRASNGSPSSRSPSQRVGLAFWHHPRESLPEEPLG